MTSSAEPSRFFRPAHPLDVPLALRALRSVGELGSALDLLTPTLQPARGGLFCQVLFGPLKDHCCHCRALHGLEHEGERCTRCSVECISSSARSERWAHIESPVGLVHPLLFPRIAALLGLEVEEVEALVHGLVSLEGGRILRPAPGQDPLHFRTERRDRPGSEQLRELLRELAPDPELRALGLRPEELILDTIPISPPGLRPLQEMTGGQRLPGWESLAFKSLVGAILRLRRLNELDAPWIIRLNEVNRLQGLFETLLDALRVQRPSLPEDEPPEAASGAPPAPRRGRGSSLACAFVGQDRALVLQAGELRLLHLAEGRWESPIQVGACNSRFVTADGRVAVLESEQGLHALELESGRWLDWIPAEMSGWELVEVRESTWIHNRRTGARLALHDLVDYPTALVSSADGRFGWALDKEGEGGIYELSTGLRHFVPGGEIPGQPRRLSKEQRIVARIFDGVEPPSPPAPFKMARDGSLTRLRLQDAHYEIPELPALAIGLPAQGPWRVLYGSRLMEGPVLRLQLGFPVRAAAFDRAGARLLLLDRKELRLLSLDGPALLGSWSIS